MSPRTTAGGDGYRWFRMPETGGEDTSFPDYLDKNGVEGWLANKEHPDGAPVWVVKVFADDMTLDSINNESGVTELSENDVEMALNSIDNKDRSYSDWNNELNIG